jgi:5'-3' exonuclease
VPAPLLLCDTPGLLYRGFFALPDSIKGAEGRPVNALVGSVNMTLWCIEKYAPRAVVMCFGQESADYRTEAYPDYHAKRPEMPDDLAWQWERAPALYEALGWSVAATDNLEADDLLGSLAAIETEAGGRTLILTGDRDMFQCASDSVTVLMQRTGGDGPEEVGPDGVREKYGIDPEQVPDFIALRGDPSDGLPGAKGIGAKTAADLLRRKGDLGRSRSTGRRTRRPTTPAGRRRPRSSGWAGSPAGWRSSRSACASTRSRPGPSWSAGASASAPTARCAS